MSDEQGRHFCREARNLDEKGGVFCLLLKRRVLCSGLSEECKIEGGEDEDHKERVHLSISS